MQGHPGRVEEKERPGDTYGPSSSDHYSGVQPPSPTPPTTHRTPEIPGDDPVATPGTPRRGSRVGWGGRGTGSEDPPVEEAPVLVKVALGLRLSSDDASPLLKTGGRGKTLSVPFYCTSLSEVPVTSPSVSPKDVPGITTFKPAYKCVSLTVGNVSTRKGGSCATWSVPRL